MKSLEWFCSNCERSDKYLDSTNNKNIQIDEANLFFSLIKKMPEGSIAASMFRDLVAHFFPSLLKSIEYDRGSGKIESINFNFNPFENVSDIVSYLAYVLPQNQLKEIVQLDESKYYSYSTAKADVFYKGGKYFLRSSLPDSKSDITDQYQKDMKKKFRQI